MAFGPILFRGFRCLVGLVRASFYGVNEEPMRIYPNGQFLLRIFEIRDVDGLRHPLSTTVRNHTSYVVGEYDEGHERRKFVLCRPGVWVFFRAHVFVFCRHVGYRGVQEYSTSSASSYTAILVCYAGFYTCEPRFGKGVLT